MPQISQLPFIYASQIFWLALVFGTIFFVIGRGMVPKIHATVEARDGKIAEDLATAERARAEAEETEAAYRARMDESRAEALKVAQASKLESARDAEARVKDADSEIAARTREAEDRIATATAAALSDLESVAAEAAREMVAKLAGLTVSPERASAAVKAVLNG